MTMLSHNKRLTEFSHHLSFFTSLLLLTPLQRCVALPVRATGSQPYMWRCELMSCSDNTALSSWIFFVLFVWFKMKLYGVYETVCTSVGFIISLTTDVLPTFWQFDSLTKINFVCCNGSNNLPNILLCSYAFLHNVTSKKNKIKW